MIRRTSPIRLGWALVAVLPLVFAGCDDETVNEPTAVNPLFVRYASLGNSLTAGLQSAGLNDSLQNQAYPVLLAEAMQTDFTVPLLRSPGCPPPYVNIFTQERLGGGAAPPCALREAPIPTRINNLAIPGAEVVEMINYFDPGLIPSETDAFKTFLLGGHTPVEAATQIKPTFVSIAIGSNDLLGAALDDANAGDPDRVTPPATFAERYDAMLDSLDAIGSLEGGVLMGVQPLQLSTGASVPYFSPGAAWQQFEVAYDAQLDAAITAATGGQITTLNTLDVAPACATVFVPFPVGGGALGTANALAGMVFDSLAQGIVWIPTPVTLACTDETVIIAAEWVNLVTAAAAYNAHIQQVANERGWAYYDPAPVFTQLAGTPGAFRPFPAFDPTDQQHETQPFGFALSRDGIHWSALLHEQIAAGIADAINDQYGTSLSP
jgi:hypothetical protein